MVRLTAMTTDSDGQTDCYDYTFCKLQFKTN